jgi:hypothetical protein
MSRDSDRLLGGERFLRPGGEVEYLGPERERERRWGGVRRRGGCECVLVWEKR